VKPVKKIYYFTNIAPHYRQRLWEVLAELKEIDVEFYFGSGSKKNRIKEMNFETETWVRNNGKIHHLKNRRLFGRIVWQSGVLRTVLTNKMEAAILLADPNIVSNWLAAMFLKLKGANVYFWGHGLMEEKIGGRRFIKKIFYWLSDESFVYSKRAKEIMIEQGFDKNKIYVIYNSLDYDKHIETRSKVINRNFMQSIFDNKLPVICFVGRLTPVKKLDILVHAVHLLNKEYAICNLLIIGTGSEESNLKKQAKELLSDSNYYFFGPCYEEEEIGKLLANSDLCVSPGNIGLTAIHSLSYGTPVCSHFNFNNQMPESEAIIENKTGILFKENDPYDLANKIKSWLHLNIERKEIRKNCYSIIDNLYNPYFQVEIFKNAFLGENSQEKPVPHESSSN